MKLVEPIRIHAPAWHSRSTEEEMGFFRPAALVNGSHRSTGYLLGRDEGEEMK
jgi:hypothetical protein